ncbi:hypothetical protein ACLOJK_028301, partial [Asimina triloba]
VMELNHMLELQVEMHEGVATAVGASSDDGWRRGCFGLIAIFFMRRDGDGVGCGGSDKVGSGCSGGGGEGAGSESVTSESVLGSGMSRNFLVEKCWGSKVIGLRGSLRSKNGVLVCGGGCGVGEFEWFGVVKRLVLDLVVMVLVEGVEALVVVRELSHWGRCDFGSGGGVVA